MTEERFDTSWTDVPTCPHCGAEDADWWDGSTLNGDGDCDTVSCGYCENPYDVTMSVSYNFDTTATTHHEVKLRDCKRDIRRLENQLKFFARIEDSPVSEWEENLEAKVAKLKELEAIDTSTTDKENTHD